MRLALLAVTVVWVPALCVGAAARRDAGQHSERRKRQAMFGQGSGCADMSLFNYLLYYYLIQAQNAHQKHAQADQMAAALLKLKRRRGTDPLPTLISTLAGQSALLAMLQNVAQNNPNQLLQLLTSIRSGGQPRPMPQPQPQPQPQYAGFGGGGSGYRQAAALGGFPALGGSGVYGGLQTSSALYSPQVQQALYQQRLAQAQAIRSLPLPFGVSVPGGEEVKLDNALQFSPSLRRQVYAPQPELEPTPPPARTIFRPPSTRLHVSTVTFVTTILTSRLTTVPFVYNGLQSTTEIMYTATHVLTATQLRTLAVVVTPTVVEANGHTTTLYGGSGAPNVEIVTDLDFHDDEPAAQSTSQATPTAPTLMTATAVHVQPGPPPVASTAVVTQTASLPAVQTIVPSNLLQVQTGVTTVLGPAVPTTPPPPPTTTTTTTTKKPQPGSRLLSLLRSRASSRRRGVPLRGVARRRHEEQQKAKKRQEAELREAEQQKRQQESSVSTSVSVSVSRPGQPPVPVVVPAQLSSTVAAQTTLPPPPAPVFRPQQVPIYVEKDGVLVIVAAALTPAASSAQPTQTTPAPVLQVVQATPAPVLQLTVVTDAGAAATTAPEPPLQTPATQPTPAPPPQTQPTAATTVTTTAAPTTAPTTASTTTTTTTTSDIDELGFGFNFEETVYASPSSLSSDPTTEKVVTEEDFQNLLDGTFVILAKALPDAGVAPPSEGSGGGSDDSDVKVSVSYAVSTSVSEGRR